MIGYRKLMIGYRKLMMGFRKLMIGYIKGGEMLGIIHAYYLFIYISYRDDVKKHTISPPHIRTQHIFT